MKTIVDVEKSIKSFLKRSKMYSYSTALLVTFLITGHMAYTQEEIIITEEIVETVPSRQQLDSEIDGQKAKIDELLRANENSINKIDIEVAELLEQAEQVVKPWHRSWQLGVNYLWSKDKRDSKKRPVVYRKKFTNPLERFISKSALAARRASGTLGVASITPVPLRTLGATTMDFDTIFEEPKSEVTLTIGITPKSAPDINVTTPNVTPPTISAKFEPTFIKAPTPPEITPPTPPVITPPELTGGGANPSRDKYSIWYGSNDGIISQITVKKGTITLEPGNKVTATGYEYDASIPKQNGYSQSSSHSDTTPPDGVQESFGQRFFNTLLNVPYSEFGKDVVINNRIDNFILIDLETEGRVKDKRLQADGTFSSSSETGTLELYKNNKYIDETRYNELKSYKDYSGICGEDANEALVFINKGQVNLEGQGSTYFYTTSHTDGEYRTNFIDNEGTITAKGKDSIIIKHTPDTGQAKAWIYSNEGKMYADGEGAIIAGWAYKKLPYGRAGFVNNGIAQARGPKSIGVFFSYEGLTDNSTMREGHLVYLKKPIDLLGDKSMGFVSMNNGEAARNEKNLARVTIGKEAPQPFGQITKPDYKDDKVDEAIGILQSQSTETKVTATVDIEEYSNKGIGMIANKGTLTILEKTPGTEDVVESLLTISGGTENNGIVTAEGVTGGGSRINPTVEYNGKINVTGGTGTKLAIAQPTSTIRLFGNINIGNSNNYIKDITGAYATGIDGVVYYQNPDKIKAYMTGNSVIAFADNNGQIYMELNDTPADPTIFVKSETGDGVPFIAQNAGKIQAKHSNVKIENGGNAAYADGANSKITLTHSKIDYSGKGYALYASNGAIIDFSGSELLLRGKSTAMELDQSTTTNSVLTDNDTKFTVMSNDVTVFNITNLSAPLQVSNLNVAGLAGVDIAVNAGTENGITYDKYKLAAIDGAKLTIDVPINKGDNDPVSDSYFKRFLGQRIELDVDKDVTAFLTSQQAKDYFKDQVVVLEGNSSEKATALADNSINIKSGVKVSAARLDNNGNGAIGVFINHGIVDNKGEIIIGKNKDGSENSNPNKQGIGIYAVNGSKIDNSGKIEIAGDEGIGILAMSYRLDDDGNPVVDEFGTVANQGEIHINNTGSIKVTGNKAIGIYARNNKDNTVTNQEVHNNGDIELTGNGAVGMYGEGPVKVTNDKNILIKGQKNNIALLGRNGAEMVNNAKLVLPDVATVEDAHIGMFTDDSNTKLINNNDIEIGKNSIGIYAKDIAVNSGKLKVSSGGIGVISSGGTVLLDTNANITLADSMRPVPVTTHSSSSVRPNITLASSTEENPSIALMTTGNNSDVTNKADIDVGKEGYAFVFKNSGTAGNPGIKFKNEGSTIKLKDNATYIYSEDKFGEIKLDQDTRVEANGDKVYAIYSAGKIVNDGTIDMSQGKGNVAIYGYGGATLTNDEHGKIIVSATDRANQLYGIGMAAGEVNPETKEIISTSTIVNKGTIEVDKEGSIGMFAIGRGSKAVNEGTINISENKAIGMYIDNGAVGENHGTIEITDATKTGINAIFAVNNAVIKNYGRIIVDGSSNNGIYQVNSEIKEKGTIVVNSVESDDTSVNSYQIATVTASKPEKSLGDVAMKKNPKTGNIEVIIDGKEVNPVRIDTINPVDNSHKIEEITINSDIMNISNFHMQDHVTDSMINNLGMYVDTSGINFTKPIEGLDTVGNIDALDLILGIEATEYTNAKTIEVGENIMDPYNEVVKKLKSNNAEIRFDIHAGSLTWLGTIKETASKSAFEYAVLQKIPYTIAAEDKDGNIINQDLYNELDGIEQRYGIEPLGSRERLVFTKLNGIGKGEPELFEQAVNEMKGNQYSNTLRRVRTSHDTFAREFDNLMHWRTETKDTMKVKVFGETSKYRSGKLDVNDYTRDAQGIIILNNNETVRLGQSSGFFGGAANEQFKFKDIGGSKEKAITGEIGYYKSNAYGYNNEINWTWKAGIEGSYRRMDRKYLVVDDIFHAKSKYNTYGVFIDNRVGRNYRVTENLTVEPYAGLDLAAGKVGKIHENKGEIRLDVKSKDYYSVVPNAGVKAKYNIPAGKNSIVTSVDVNVSKEVGNIYDNTMKAKVNRTSAGYYSLVNDKKDNATVGVVGRIGVENESYGVALKAGYSSANKAINGGLEFRVKF